MIVLGWIAKHVPNNLPSERSLRASWKILVPVGVSVPAIFFFLFNSALIPLAVGTMAVGAFVILLYERLLTGWARKGFNDLQRLGLMAGALGFWVVFWDPLLEFLGRIGTSVLGLAFAVYILSLRKKLLGQSNKSPLDHLSAELPKPSEPRPISWKIDEIN